MHAYYNNLLLVVLTNLLSAIVTTVDEKKRNRWKNIISANVINKHSLIIRTYALNSSSYQR